MWDIQEWIHFILTRRLHRHVQHYLCRDGKEANMTSYLQKNLSKLNCICYSSVKTSRVIVYILSWQVAFDRYSTLAQENLAITELSSQFSLGVCREMKSNCARLHSCVQWSFPWDSHSREQAKLNKQSSLPKAWRAKDPPAQRRAAQ